jgi:hypothetical protein
MVSVNLTSPVPGFNQYQNKTAADQTAIDHVVLERLKLEMAREQVAADLKTVRNVQGFGLSIGLIGGLSAMCLVPFTPFAIVAAPLGGIIGSTILSFTGEASRDLGHQDAKLTNQQKDLLNQVNQLA